MDKMDLKYRIVTSKDVDEGMLVESLVVRLTGSDCVCTKRIRKEKKPTYYQHGFWMTDAEYDIFWKLLTREIDNDIEKEFLEWLESNC